MHLRIPIVLCCAVLVGFAAATQSGGEKTFFNSEIDIDDDLEGSGGDTEVSRDLESSGSGSGPPDDEDSPDIPSRTINVPPESKPIEPTTRFDSDLGKQPPKEGDSGRDSSDNSIVIMNPKSEDRPAFFAQPGILAAVIGGVVVGLVCAILVVMFIVYRMRKKDEGSYALDEPKRSPTSNSYNRGGSNKEFYA